MVETFHVSHVFIKYCHETVRPKLRQAAGPQATDLKRFL